MLVRNFAVYRIQRLKDANPHHRAVAAARLYGSRRAWMWANRRASVVVTLGHDRDVSDRAEAVLLDEFVPLTEENARA